MNYLKLQIAQTISKKSFNLESTITESSITFPNGTQIPSSLLDRVTSIIKSRRLKPVYEQLKKWHTICLITCLIRCHIISTAITSDNLFFFFFFPVHAPGTKNRQDHLPASINLEKSPRHYASKVNFLASNSYLKIKTHGSHFSPSHDL